MLDREALDFVRSEDAKTHSFDMGGNRLEGIHVEGDDCGPEPASL